MTTTPAVPARSSESNRSSETDRPTATTVLGYPRLGRHRELKRIVESHWAGDVDADRVREVARDVRATTWKRLVDLGLDRVPSNVASLYDHVLDAAVLVDAVPSRFRHLVGQDDDAMALRFGMARGTDDAPPLELTKWFDTNYHYLVPEIDGATPFRLADDQPLREVAEARALSLDTRPVLVGPVTFLLLAKAADGAPDGFRPLDRLDDLVAVYAELLTAFADRGVSAVQFDEPVLVTDLDAATREAIGTAYRRLAAVERRPELLVATYFGDASDHLGVVVETGVEAVAVDLTATEPSTLSAVPGIDRVTVVAGVVDGRNVWRTDPDVALERLRALEAVAGRVVVAPSCSLQHVPHDVDDELDLDPRLRSWLAFADQKVTEVVSLARALDGDEDTGTIDEARRAVADRPATTWTRDEVVRSRLAALDAEATRRPDAGQRRDAQADLGLPSLPTTTIGSFPQTAEVRAARAAHRSGELDEAGYRQAMHDEIARVVALQEELGLDVLVHGEPERNDMVQYFAEQLAGFATTRAGWVQSYGTRAVRPPILYGDVHRPAPMTTHWFGAAQALTDRPVKGMLTGPVTILAWSFVRDDQPLADTAAQVALAIRDEVADLEEAGARIVQVDEPALRELLPLRAAQRPEYLAWSVRAFRLATAGASLATQVHTHLCYSEFGDVIEAIHALDADVTSVEAARSRMEVVAELDAIGFDRGVGPGVYDIHAPRVPSVEELVQLLRTAAAGVPADRLWVNPDCGLKTRGYAEVEPALRNLVAAARQVRDELTSTSSS